MCRLTLIRGMVGSGKSTLAQKLVFQSKIQCVHLEADMFFMKNGEYKFDPSKLSDAHYWCRERTEYYLKNWYNVNVIVSNTFTTKKELKPYFDIAGKFGIIPVVILCQNEFGSIHNVPEETIEKMKNRFQYDITELFHQDH